MRKFWFLYPAKALVMFPGGFGTLDEFMEVLTLVQTKKIKKNMTIILYGQKYWNQVINFEAMVKYRTISRSDLKLFTYADTPQDAFDILKRGLTRNYL
jgi:predicted Rossmann-fold nucleotide-binding protein